MTSEFKGTKVDIGDVFYYKENSIILDKPEIVTVVEIASNNSSASYENYGVKLKSPYGYDFASFVVDDLTRLGDDKLTYIGNKYKDKFIEVSNITGEVLGEIKIGKPFSKGSHIEPANENNIVVSDDVEPVAWRYKRESQKVWCISQTKPNDGAWGIIEPLYTANQLHPRVKMTRDERVEFDNLYRMHMTVVGALKKVFNNQNYEKLNNRFMQFDTTQAELANLLVDFVPDLPEETIEIVPDMKWFVRSKERNSEKNFYYFVGKRPQDLFILYGYKRAAKKFDTKEEAEKWTNPDTEAVHLPVEEK